MTDQTPPDVGELKEAHCLIKRILDGGADPLLTAKARSLYQAIDHALDASAKVPVGEYRVDLVSGDYCVVDCKHVVVFRCVTGGDSADASKLLNRLTTRVAELEGDCKDETKWANDYCHQVQTLTAENAKLKERVAELEVLNGKEIVKRLDAEMDATALTAKNTELREQLDKIDLIAYQALVDSGVIEPAQPSDRSVK